VAGICVARRRREQFRKKQKHISEAMRLYAFNVICLVRVTSDMGWCLKKIQLLFA
jgi:hypothetical protein